MRESPLLDLASPYPALLAVLQRLEAAEKQVLPEPKSVPRQSAGREPPPAPPAPASRQPQYAALRLTPRQEERLRCAPIDSKSSSRSVSRQRSAEASNGSRRSSGASRLEALLAVRAAEQVMRAQSEEAKQLTPVVPAGPAAATEAQRPDIAGTAPVSDPEPPVQIEQRSQSCSSKAAEALAKSSRPVLAPRRRLPPPPAMFEHSTGAIDFERRHSHGASPPSVRSASTSGLSLQASEPFQDRNLGGWPSPNLFLYGVQRELMGSILSGSTDDACMARARASSQRCFQRSLSARGSQQRSRSLQSAEPYVGLNDSAFFRFALSARTKSDAEPPLPRAKSATPISSQWMLPHRTAASTPAPVAASPTSFVAATVAGARSRLSSRDASDRRTPFEAQARPLAAALEPRASQKATVQRAGSPRRSSRNSASSSSPPVRYTSAAIPAESDAADPYIWLPASAQWVQGNTPSSQPRRPWLYNQESNTS